jgi:hypothetical protein
MISEWWLMSAKAYILLEVIEGECDQAARILRRRPGVVSVDIVEGPPYVVFIVEAAERQSLAKLTVGALAAVERITMGVQLLPTCDGRSTQVNTEPAYARRSNKGKKRGSSRESMRREA